MKILDEQKSNIGHNKSIEIGNGVYVKEIVIITKTNFNTSKIVENMLITQ